MATTDTKHTVTPAAAQPKAGTPSTSLAPRPGTPDRPQTGKPADTKPADTKTAAPSAKNDSLDESFVDTVVMLAPALAQQAAPIRARSAKQAKMDETVKRLHTAWVTKGKASQWPKMVEARVVATYFVEPSKSAELKRLINRAVQFHGVRARYGTSFVATEKLVAQHGLPAEYVGREVLSFAVMDKRPRAADKSDNGS